MHWPQLRLHFFFFARQHHQKNGAGIKVCHFLLLGLCSQEEERLVRDLFRGYNKLIRPVQNMTQKVEVAFGLAFIQLINVVRFFIHRTANLLRLLMTRFDAFLENRVSRSFSYIFMAA